MKYVDIPSDGRDLPLSIRFMHFMQITHVF